MKQAVRGGDLTLKPQTDPQVSLRLLVTCSVSLLGSRTEGAAPSGLFSCLRSGLCQQDVGKVAWELRALITPSASTAAPVLNT